MSQSKKVKVGDIVFIHNPVGQAYQRFKGQSFRVIRFYESIDGVDVDTGFEYQKFFGPNEYRKVEESSETRTFSTGANRNRDEGKLDYEGFLNPLCLQRYAEYMHKHRKLADGTLRSSDNWQKGFGDDHLSVCMKSAYRHFMEWHLAHRKNNTKESIEESICALIFNANAYLMELLKDGKGIHGTKDDN